MNDKDLENFVTELSINKACTMFVLGICSRNDGKINSDDVLELLESTKKRIRESI